MPSPGSSNKKMLLFAVAAVIAGVGAMFAPAEKKDVPAPAAASAPPLAKQTKEQAMTALMALPELKAWSEKLAKTSGGTVRGALIEYDQTPKLVNGKSYWQFSFVENGKDAAHRWESFLVADDGDILVEDFDSDKQLTLSQWRKDKKPMER